jgi:hypothetical protein
MLGDMRDLREITFDGDSLKNTDAEHRCFSEYQWWSDTLGLFADLP